MRESSSVIGVVRYPDSITFAFNPNIVTVATSEDVKVKVGKYEDTREPFNGKVEFDISKYYQTFVTKDERHKVIQVTLESVSGSFTFSTLVIWGAISIGESWNEPHTVKWYKGKPFTFELYIPGDARLYARYDSGSYVEIPTNVIGRGIVSVDPMVLWPEASRQIVLRVDEGEIRGVFDYTFDHTFNGMDAGQTLLYRIDVMDEEDECNGVYLRWIDWHGWQRYWMFKRGERQDVVKLSTVTDVVLEAYGRSFKSEKVTDKSSSRVMKLCAPLVDDVTYEILTGLVKSLNIEMRMKNGEWLPVNIDGQSMVRAADNVARPLNDFECTLLLPEVMIPRL